ncbi:MAG TPA: DUF4893 domain-containing protein [Sphingomonadaceae bacterium]|nr:DUF4893 domain-containing protein [Sphingomonadaceae bacterium]
MKGGVLLLATALAGCAPGGGDRLGIAAQQGWRAVAMPADRTRIGDWRKAWTEGLRRARAAGHGGEIAREGALLHPDAALTGAALPDGAYACRVIKLGAQSEGGLHYVAYPRFDCRIDREDGLQHFTKLTGSQRPTGHLFPDSDRRTVFLGTLILADERMAIRYGRDRERDMAGVVERIGPQRWRLALPYPRFESLIDVIELVPVG